MSKQLLTSDIADIKLAKRLESIGRTLAERTERERQTTTAPAPQPSPPAKVVQLFPYGRSQQGAYRMTYYVLHSLPPFRAKDERFSINA